MKDNQNKRLSREQGEERNKQLSGQKRFRINHHVAA